MGRGFPSSSATDDARCHTMMDESHVRARRYNADSAFTRRVASTPTSRTSGSGSGARRAFHSINLPARFLLSPQHTQASNCPRSRTEPLHKPA